MSSPNPSLLGKVWPACGEMPKAGPTAEHPCWSSKGKIQQPNLDLPAAAAWTPTTELSGEVVLALGPGLTCAFIILSISDANLVLFSRRLCIGQKLFFPCRSSWAVQLVFLLSVFPLLKKKMMLVKLSKRGCTGGTFGKCKE